MVKSSFVIRGGGMRGNYWKAWIVSWVDLNNYDRAIESGTCRANGYSGKLQHISNSSCVTLGHLFYIPFIGASDVAWLYVVLYLAVDHCMKNTNNIALCLRWVCHGWISFCTDKWSIYYLTCKQNQKIIPWSRSITKTPCVKFRND